MNGVVFSEAARRDRRAITAFTVERFGVLQARRLRDQFEVALNALSESPFIGRTNEELDPPGHRFRYYIVMKSFMIVYEPAEEGVHIARILHGAPNLLAELDHDAGDYSGTEGA